MLENATTELKGCEQQQQHHQQIDDVDVVDSGCVVDNGSSAVATIDFSIDDAKPGVSLLVEPPIILAVDGDSLSQSPQIPDKCEVLPAEQATAESAVVPIGVERSDNELLKEALAKANIQLMQLQTVLAQRDSMVELQQKELSLLQNEKVSIRREYDVAKKEKEAAVVRYAMVEKTIIDLNSAKDLAARKNKDAIKENEHLSNRLKTVCGERDKSLKEHRDSIRECEALKSEMQMWESKNKYNQVKIKHEMANKAALETKLADLTQQFNQLSDERQQRLDSDKRSEQEQGAQIILLKHLVDEKDKEMIGLQQKLSHLTTEFMELSDKYNLLVVDHEFEKIEKVRHQERVTELEILRERNNQRGDDLQQRLANAETECQSLSAQHTKLCNELEQLRETADEYNYQREEMAQVRAKENELLAFIKELTEKSVIVENQLILATSKAAAFQLENDKTKNDFETQKRTIQSTDEQLNRIKLKRNEEAKVFGRLLTEKKIASDRLATELENVQGELVTQQRKYTQIVKELNRELAELRSSNQSSPRSIKSSNGSGSDPGASHSQHSRSNGDSLDTAQATKEPTAKAFIARIARLQAVLAKQTEKIEFLENHCIALTNELRNKSA